MSIEKDYLQGKPARLLLRVCIGFHSSCDVKTEESQSRGYRDAPMQPQGLNVKCAQSSAI